MSRQVMGEPAGRVHRLLATLIDAALVPPITIFLVMVFGIVEDAEDFTDRWWIFQVLALAIATYLVLNGYLLWHHGQTVGKKLLGVAIVDKTTEQGGTHSTASFWKLVFIRAWFFPLLFIGIIPYFTIAVLADLVFIFSRQRRCLHDYVCGTAVIRLNKENNI